MKKHVLTLFFIALLIIPVFGLTEVKKWEPFEIRFIAKKSYDNPYVEAMPHNGEALLRVTFIGISGTAARQKYTVEGFWDGDIENRDTEKQTSTKRNTFRICFAPPQTGVWQYESFSSDPGITSNKLTVLRHLLFRRLYINISFSIILAQ
jgi:hypothetical protein